MPLMMRAPKTDVSQEEEARIIDMPVPKRPTWLNPFAIPGPLTLKQKLYILLPQCLGAAIIDGAANFGVACAMYRTTTGSIRVWPLDQNTIAGDMAVTVFIQGIITFMVTSAMVHVDLRRGVIDPFPYPWPDPNWGARKIEGEADTKHGAIWKWFHNQHGLGRGLHFFSGSDVNDIFDFSIPWKQIVSRWFWSLWKGSVLSALYFFPFWGIGIAIVAPIWEHKNMQGTWAPELIKLIYGFLLGLFMNPVCCMIAMGSEDSIRLHIKEEQKKRLETFLASKEPVPPISEAEQQREQRDNIEKPPAAALKHNATPPNGYSSGDMKEIGSPLALDRVRRSIEVENSRKRGQDADFGLGTTGMQRSGSVNSTASRNSVAGVDALRKSLDLGRSVSPGRHPNGEKRITEAQIYSNESEKLADSAVVGAGKS